MFDGCNPGATHTWRVRTRLPHRFGQRLRVLARGRLNSCLVEFADGHRVVTSRNYLRRLPWYELLQTLTT